VALINGEATVKRYYRKKDAVELRPANSAMTPILVSEGDLRIQGRIIGVLRKYK
jgi:repressor LexA